LVVFAVNLDQRGPQRQKVPQSRVAGTGVVDRYQRSGSTQLVQVRFQLDVGVNGGLLGQFDDEAGQISLFPPHASDVLCAEQFG
jgi:hypothetical protein